MDFYFNFNSPGVRVGQSGGFLTAHNSVLTHTFFSQLLPLVESPVDLTSYDIPFRRTFGAFSHICTLTCRGDVTYSIENLPSRGRAHGRDTRVHPHRAPWSSPPASSPHHTASEFRILFEPTHGKTTKIALQATPGVLRSYRITSSRSLLSHHQLPSTAVCRTPGRGAPEGGPPPPA